MARKGSARKTPLLMVMALSILTIGVAVLVAFALRVEPIPTAGDTPSAIESFATPTATAPTSSPPPTLGATAPIAIAERAIDVEGSTVVRAELGACGLKVPAVEISEDGGITWEGSTLPDGVAQVVAVNVVDSEQFDLVVLQGAACAPMNLTTYTGGQFWESYPERLATATYFDPSDPVSVVLAGTPQLAPCETPLELSDVDGSISMRCAEGIAVTPNAQSGWTAITGASVRAATRLPVAAGAVPAVIAAEVGGDSRDGCGGLVLVSFADDASTPEGVPAGCAPTDPRPAALALTSEAGTVWLWADDQVLTSADGGKTWASRG